jgi:Rod binding domain-containing protein
MNVSLPTNWNRTPQTNSPLAKPAEKNDVAKNEKAARDFEAMLLTPVLDALQKTFSGAQDSSTPGASDYRLMGTQALAQSIAARGGIGIGQLILRHLQPPKVPGWGGTGV